MNPDDAWTTYVNRPKGPRNPDVAVDAETLQDLLANPDNSVEDLAGVMTGLLRTIEVRVMFYNNTPIGAIDTLPLENFPDQDLAKRFLWMLLTMYRAEPGSEKGLEEIMMAKTTFDHPGGR